MGSAARLKLRQQVADVRLDRLLGEEEPLADLTVDETVRDELENLDLAGGRLLLELAQGQGERDHLAVAVAVAVAPRRSRGLEAAAVVDVAAQDLLALGSVHTAGIDRLSMPL